MKRLAILIAAALALAAAGAQAQNAQPYAGWQTRPLKALSDEQLADLNAGRGMGLALAAELNGYPGPRHVLDLASALELTPEQQVRVAALFDAMTAETVALGKQLIAQESELDRLFASKAITKESLAAKVQEIGATQAKLRAAHLRYHLSTNELLTAAQVKRYADLRGYAGGAPHQHVPGMMHPQAN
jgi:Spy/CpxP family protein refolding chaperone